MSFRNLIAGLAIAATGAVFSMSAANAALVQVVDDDFDSTTFSGSVIAPNLVGTLDFNNSDGFGFDAVSNSYKIFGDGNNNHTYSFGTNDDTLVSVSVFAPTEPTEGYTTATVTIAGIELDLLNGDFGVATQIAVSSPFDVVLNFAGATSTLSNFTVSLTAVPLPAGVLLLLTALGGLVLVGRRRSAVAA